MTGSVMTITAEMLDKDKNPIGEFKLEDKVQKPDENLTNLLKIQIKDIIADLKEMQENIRPIADKDVIWGDDIKAIKACKKMINNSVRAVIETFNVMNELPRV